MATVVVDHKHEGDLYRLVVAEEVWREDVDEDGNTTQVLHGHQNSEDFVFAAHDPMWHGMEAEDIASAQRTIVAAELQRRSAEQDLPAQGHRDLPGIGEEL